MLTILLVEDNEGVGKFAANLLRELGQTVTWVGDARSALERLENDRSNFDLVFSDVVMPGMSGIELAHAANVASGDGIGRDVLLAARVEELADALFPALVRV